MASNESQQPPDGEIAPSDPTVSRNIHSSPIVTPRIPPASSPFISPARRVNNASAATGEPSKPARAPDTRSTGEDAINPQPSNESGIPSLVRHPEPYVFIPMPSRTPSPVQNGEQAHSTAVNGYQQLATTTNTVSEGVAAPDRGRGRVTSRRGNGRARGRARGRGRGRGRARSTRAGANRNARGTNPAAGWNLVPSRAITVMLEKDYVHSHVSQGARLFFCSSAVERLGVELDVKKLKKSRSDVYVLLCDELVGKCVEWLNELVVLKNVHDKTITAANMYRYLAIMLYSQCTGFSFRKTIEILGKLVDRRLDEGSLSFINTNILAYSATGRGDDDSLVWNAQRDQTVMLGQFERAAFRMSSRIFLSPNHTILSLDDDLMGTRATDNQVKTISARKADGEGHTADVIADALFRVVLRMRFRRRHDTLELAVGKTFSTLLETRGDLNRQGIMVVADRGYARRNILNVLMDQGLCCLGVMPEYMLKCHPIVGRSYLQAAPFDEYSDEDEPDGNEVNTDGDVVRYDRPSQFVVDDGASLGPGVKVAKSNYKPEGRTQEEITAIAVREYGNAKRSKVIRFMYSMKAAWRESLFTWVAIPYERNFRGYLFTTRDDEGRVVEPDGVTLRSAMEQHLLQSCEVLAVGQRCADWFVMRQFRITATLGSKMLMYCPELRQAAGYEPKAIPVEISQPMLLILELSKSWFTTKRSTEAMVRGTVNEDAVLNYLKRQTYTKALYCVGLISLKDSPWLASSPDAILMLDMTKLEETFYADQITPCTVEIKTSVSSTAVQERTNNATRDLILMDYTHPDLHKCIPEEHFGQMIHQVVTANVVAGMYVAASESQVLYTIVVMFEETMLEHVSGFIDNIGKEAIGWAHEEDASVPLDVYDDELEDLLLERLPFWHCVNKLVRERGPFMPIRVFRHSSQTFYAKTRGGVDGNAQNRAILKNSSGSLKWEQKVVTHTFKTILVNAFIAWRMLMKDDLLQTREAFGDLSKYRQRLNRVQCMADYAHDTALELLDYADSLSRIEEEEERQNLQPTTITESDKVRLVNLARRRKRKRIPFFNRGDGMKLRLEIPSHPHLVGDRDIYCALCGQNRQTTFRGHRTNHKCGYCNVHLCVRIRAGFRKSCWEVWHKAARLKPRAPLHFPNTSNGNAEISNEDSDGAGEGTEGAGEGTEGVGEGMEDEREDGRREGNGDAADDEIIDEDETETGQRRRSETMELEEASPTLRSSK